MYKLLLISINGLENQNMQNMGGRALVSRQHAACLSTTALLQIFICHCQLLQVQVLKNSLVNNSAEQHFA